MSRRPSHKELTAKLTAAREAIEARRVVAVNPTKFQRQIARLGIATQGDLTAAIVGVFGELRPEHYANAGRPDKCTEVGFENLDMWPFVVTSATLGCEVYVKFVLVGETIAMTLGLVSFHD